MLFPDDAACAEHLANARWPEGFSCPVCGTRKGWALDRNRPTWECAECRRQTSVTAGTILHRSHLPLKTWFLAAHIVATHSNGISALQLQGQLGIGSHKTAWLLLQKLRRAMVDPGRSPLQTLVEIDETEMPFRSKRDRVDQKTGGRSPVGKIFIVGAVELSDDGQPRRNAVLQRLDLGTDEFDLRGAGGVCVHDIVRDGKHLTHPNVPARTNLRALIAWLMIDLPVGRIIHRGRSNWRDRAQGLRDWHPVNTPTLTGRPESWSRRG